MTDKVKRKVKMFGKVKLCEVKEYNGENKDHVYSGIHEVYWIERGEDQYGIPQFEKKSHPRVIVYRKNWLRGKEIT